MPDGGLEPVRASPELARGTPPPSVRSIRYFRDGGSSGQRDYNPGDAGGTAAGGEGRRGGRQEWEVM